jgi:hypothetical protein
MEDAMTRERDRLEMWERAVEQGLATVRGDEHEWLPGAGPSDVDWTCEREDDEQEDTTDE